MAPNTLVWDEVMVDAFQYLIDTLSSSHVLWVPREGDRLVVHTDASYEGLGAVLSAERDAIQRPLGFYSKKLLPAERNNAATELECLAVYKSIDHFAKHLVGIHFEVVRQPSFNVPANFNEAEWKADEMGLGSTSL